MLRTTIGVAVAVLLAATAGPAAAQSKPKPKTTVATGSATGILPDAVTARGVVRPNGVSTTFSFQYGTTRRYEATTPEFDAGDGKSRKSVKAALLGLAPATTYHFRIVARNSRGVVRGKDRTFKTRKQPLGLVLTPSANPALAGQPVTFTGQLSGTDQDDRRLTLEAKPFPYTSDFTRVPGVNDVVTTAGTAGAFTFTVPAVPFNTQFRVAVAGKSDVVSPIVALGVTPRISTVAPSSVRKPRGRKARVRFTGRISPNRDGSQVLVQKRVRGDWETVGITTATRVTDLQSRFRKTIRQKRGGTYRVVVNPVDGAFAPVAGATQKVKVRRR